MSEKRVVLVVDDNRINRLILKKILEDSYYVIEAKNGAEALDILRHEAESISAILLDIIMPAMDGYKVLEALSEDSFLSTIPVIVTTGNSGDDAEDKVLALGAHDFLTKPYRTSVIKHRLANTIKLRETAALVNSIERDELTGAYNKEFFYKKSQKLLLDNPELKFDMVCMDIEHFKLTNDLLGISVGDKILIHIASELNDASGEHGICGRIGGDKFAYLTPHRESYTDETFADIMKKINSFDNNVAITASFGIFVADDIKVPIGVMCDRALIACNTIKGKYGTYFAYYDNKLRQIMLSEQYIVDGMKDGISQKQFQVFYQPKYDIHKEKVAGAEALVRWIHPEKGFMSPGEFIPIFEKNGFITEVDYYVWERVCEDIHNWLEAGMRIVPVSVNVSRADIYNPMLPQMIFELTKKYNIEPKLLHLEITETSYTENPTQLIKTIEKLKEKGFIIEMDDFGSGYSSLNMLSELPIDILKLDMKFIQNESKIKVSKSILSFVISLAKWLNLPVIAEGVETKDEVELLRAMDCNYVQGYYYAKPMKRVDFEEYVENHKHGIGHNDEKPHDKKDIKILDKKDSGVMLIVDDIEANRAILSEVFSDYFTIAQVENGADALSYIEQNVDMIDIILLDLVMPVMDGFHLLEILSKNDLYCHIPVIVTSQGNDDSEARALSMGAVDFISKPYNAEVCLNRVKNVIAGERVESLEKQNDMLTKLREIEKLARTDGLTLLLNRTEFETEVTRFFNKNQKAKATFIILDIDNFKMINDQLGHIVGDEVLKAVAGRLSEAFSDGDLICRHGGDEFAVFIKSILHPDELNLHLSKLCKKLSFKFKDLKITCSIGACMSPEFGKDYQSLHQNSDIALLSAKRLGKNQFQIFNGETELPNHVLYRNMDWLMDEASDGVIVCDAENYDLLYINDVACGIPGKIKKQCAGKKCYEALWGLLEPCTHCIHIDKLTKDYCEHEIVTADNKNYIVKGKLVDWGGKPARIQYIQDNTSRAITAKKIAEISEDRKRILDLMPGGIFRYKKEDDSFDFVNKNMINMLGYTKDGFLKKFHNKFSNLVWHEDLERVLKEIDSQIAVGDVDECEYRIEKANGELCWVHDIGHLVRDENGEKWFYVTIIDITDDKKMKREIIEEQRKLEIALAHSGLQYWEHDLLTDTCINGVKGARLGFEDVTENYSKFLVESGIIPKKYVDFYLKKQQELYDGVAFVEYSIPLNTADNKQLWWKVRCTNIFDDNGKPIKTIGTAEAIEAISTFEREDKV